ncbi:hypothetical protein GCM10010464_08290 [Pseudonocardia yunnanensis]
MTTTTAKPRLLMLRTVSTQACERDAGPTSHHIIQETPMVTAPPAISLQLSRTDERSARPMASPVQV